ncbi:MAG: hypothetical protein JEZ04_01205 [Spirochaetales bacterium]|nr:hypothetical protein [Spirochaetales bacterium]
MNSVKLWAQIIPSPIQGFSKVDSTTKIALPLIIILLLSAAASMMLIPIQSSDAYADAIMRVQISNMQEKGTELSTEQIELMEQQLTSGNMKTFTIVGSVVGGVFGFALMLAVSVFLLKLFTVISKEKISLKLLLRIMVFIALISVVQMILKTFITVITDYERILSRVQETADLQYALTSPVSLAVLFDPGKIGSTLYYLIDALTDIFNWLYYGYLFAALRGAAGLSTSKALKITIAAAVVMIAVGLAFTMVVK